MQNSDFRSLTTSTLSAAQNGSARPAVLGSRARHAIQMAPRTVKVNPKDLKRNDGGEPAAKKVKTSVPKGTKLGSGYVDRAQERARGEYNDDEERKDRVKGLDFEALRKAKGGASAEPETLREQEQADTGNVDVDEELEKALDAPGNSVPVSLSEKDSRKEDLGTGTLADVPATRPQTRDELLAALKNRKKNNSLASAQSTVGSTQPVDLDPSRFRKLASIPKPAGNKHKFTEIVNGRKREVLVITNKDGTTKRKTRWIDPEPDPHRSNSGTQGQVLGGDLDEGILMRQKAEQERIRLEAEKAEQEEDDDIFGGVAEYDPLAGIVSGSEDEREATSDPNDREIPDENHSPSEAANKGEDRQVSEASNGVARPRNYFSATDRDPDLETSKDRERKDIAQDPTMLAALKRAAQIRRQEEQVDMDANNHDGIDSRDRDRNRTLLAKLQSRSRGQYADDDLDMDVDFGSRHDDDDDEDEGGRTKLSTWHDDRDNEYGSEGGDEGDKKGGGKRKRGGGAGKKRKGDKNSFRDVMSVIEGRKGA